MEDNKLVPATEGDIAEQNNTTQPDKRKHSPWWKKTLKIFAWCIGSIVALLILLLCLVAWILTPERLTPLVEKYGSEYLKADVKVKRVELTVWSSFPDMRLDITDMSINSRTLQGQPDSILKVLGPDASKLASVSTAAGSINPWKLIGGTIALGDIKMDGLALNIVSYNDSINNYDILPESEEKEEESKFKIRFGEIDIKAQGGIHYFDAAAGIDVSLASPKLKVNPTDKECKHLNTSFSGDLSLRVDGETYADRWPLSTKGDIDFDLDSMEIGLKDYSLTLAIFSCKISAAMNLGNSPVLKECSLILEPLKIATLINNLPESLIAEYPILRSIDTDMALSAEAKVSCPWKFDAPDLPNVQLNFNVPKSYISILNEDKNLPLFTLDEIALDGDFIYNGSSPELSSLRIPVFNVAGKDMSLSMSASIEEALSDNPLLKFASRGTLNLLAFKDFIPYAGSLLRGEVEADAEISCRLNDLMDLRYENIEANGSLLIRDLICELPSLATSIYSHLAKFVFGNSLADMGPRIPGTLLARAEIDTLSCGLEGMKLAVGQATLKAGASDKLLRQTSESKEITPMGMTLTAGVFKMDSQADTTKVRAHNLKADGSLTRYEGNAESPMLKAALSATGLMYADPSMRLGMKEFSSNLNAHLRTRKNKNHQKKHRKQDPSEKQFTVTPEVDEGVRSLFKRWGISGNLTSDKVRITHLLYPVPVHISGLNLDFSLDSVKLHRAKVLTQDNSLTLTGTISNIRQLVLGRVRKPLKLRLLADIENIDLNQIAYNFTLGSALESQRGHLARLSEEEQDAIVKAAAKVDTVTALASDSLPLILPRNIDAAVRIKAKKALYGDINLFNTRADLVVNDGAASIDSLQASTDFGNAYLNLLYSSRNPQLLNMAVDLGFSDINLQNLFTSFPTIAEMAPAITDLSGMVGAKLVGSFDMYPNMDIDFNSLNAVLNFTGTNLELNQSPLIRKIARMMLIRKKGALQITDMNIQISLHDNVMRLYPFKFGMEKYRFALLGQNDLSENMYYHLSVLKSPIPFKFGVNIKGTFDKPKIRFGGAKYKENEAQEMVNLIENQRVNFVRAMRLQLRKLINKAAVTYADRPEFSAYGQEKEMSHPDNDTFSDDSQFDSPLDMIGASLRTPAIKALGGKEDKLREFTKKYHIGEAAKEETDTKKKGKK